MNFKISDPNDHLFANEGIERMLKLKKEIKMDTNQQKVPQVVMATIETALLKLRATGCAYKVMLPDDVIIGHDAERLEPKLRATRRPNGTFRDHYQPVLINLQPGEVGEIPYPDEQFAVDLQASATAWMCKQWGNGSYATSVNKTKQVLEVLRLK